MRRAVAALVVTVVAVVALARFDTEPPPELNPNRVRGDGGSARVAAVGAGERGPRDPVQAARPLPAGGRRAAGPLVTTPFSAIQVEATLVRGRLVQVRTVELSGSDEHTRALNARAEPRLRESALRSGSARGVDTVSGATYTSESWRASLAAAIRAARR